MGCTASLAQVPRYTNDSKVRPVSPGISYNKGVSFSRPTSFAHEPHRINNHVQSQNILSLSPQPSRAVTPPKSPMNYNRVMAPITNIQPHVSSILPLQSKFAN